MDSVENQEGATGAQEPAARDAAPRAKPGPKPKAARDAAPRAPSASAKRDAEAAAFHEKKAKERAKEPPLDEWLELSGNRIVKKTRTRTGTHSVFHCSRKVADERKIAYRR